MNGGKVAGVIMPTQGRSWDIGLALLSKFQYLTLGSKMLRKGIIDVDQKKDGKSMTHVVSHSRGASITQGAVGGLPQNVLDRVWLTSVGGCEWTPPWAANNVRDYVTGPDPVPMAQAFGRHGFEHRRAMGINPLDPNFAPIYLEPLGAGWQHGFLEPTYRKAWEGRIKDFTDKYSDYN